MSFFQISTSSTDQILATMAGLFDSVSPIVLIVISLSLGFWLIQLIRDITTPHSEKPDWFENDPFLTEEDKTYYRRRSHGRFVSKKEIQEDEEDEI